MAGQKRREFTKKQKDMLFDQIAIAVGRRWPEFRDHPHYLCGGCGFVSPGKALFEVDHEYATARGGHNDRHPPDVAAQLSSRYPDAYLLATVGFQAELLCKGCNRSKGKAEFRRRGTGYAFTKRGEDRNPEHTYHGAPVLER